MSNILIKQGKEIGNVGSDYVLHAATNNSLGGVKIGNGLNIDANGVLSSDAAPAGNVPLNPSDTSNMNIWIVDV